MIPRVGRGSTPIRAERYYNFDKDDRRPDEPALPRNLDYALHDKGERTSHRVGWTYTHNLGTNDPHLAFAEMSWVIEHQSDLKRAAGIKATGRKIANPIYPFSLSWHPDQNPTRKEMIAAGLSALKALKMHDRQVYFVEHTDTEHKHVHMIVNRIHPETGIAHTVFNDRLILSRWASKYEREHGKIFCVQREKNNQARDIAKKEKAKGLRKHAIVKDTTSMTRKQWQKLKDAAKFKEGVPDINADVVRQEAAEQKRLLDSPEAEREHEATARQQVMSGEDRLVFRPKGAKTKRSKETIDKAVDQKAAAIKKHLQTQIDHEAARKIETLQPKEWQQKLARQLGPNVTRAWFADATFEGKTLTFPNRFKADYVKGNYLKGVTAALGDVQIDAVNQPTKAKAEKGVETDPRAEAFAAWEIKTRNALQDRQNDERAKLGNDQQRRKLRTEARIERHYGKAKAANEKALQAIKEKRTGRLSKTADRDLEAEQVVLEMNVSSAEDRMGEIVGQESAQFETEWATLNTEHSAASASLDQQVSDGMSAGYAIPEGPSAGRSEGLSADFSPGASRDR